MGIWKDKTRKDWAFKFKYQGKQYGGRGFKTRREAMSGREERRKEIKELLSQQIPASIDFETGASAYLDHSLRKHAKSTYDYKAKIYHDFIEMHGTPDITDPDMPHLITEYLQSFPTNAVYNARRKDLSALFTWLKNTYGIPETNPCLKIDLMPHVPKEKKVPTPEEVTRILLAAKPGDEQDIIMCCIHLSGRIDEILRLKWSEDINFEKRVVVLRTKKRKSGAYEADSMPMNQDLYNILWKRYKTRNSDKWVFYNEDTEDRYYHRPKMMASLCKRAGIKPIGESKRRIYRGKNKGKYQKVNLYYGFHALRHFVPTMLADQKKVGLKTLQGLLRHKNLRTTQIYVHPIDESVRAAVTELEGKFTPNLVKAPPEGATKQEKGATPHDVTP